jgi:ribosome biogenesis SPOUT family RNA methylase Rps3
MKKKKQCILVIEHCEKDLSEWLMLEYKHSVKIWEGKTVFTNVSNKKTMTTLQKLGMVEKKKANDFFYDKNCIILDPLAKKQLIPSDFSNLDAIIVGGILGYEKPKGRTKELLSDTSSFETRHIGKIQLTIDSAVFVAKAIMLGMKLSDIEITNEIEIVHDKIHSTILPFGYPIVDNTPIITPGLVEYITKD